MNCFRFLVSRPQIAVPVPQNQDFTNRQDTIQAKCARKSDYPFDDYKINKFDTSTQKRAIAKTEVLKFTQEVPDLGKRQYVQLSKDIFVFSYLCGGINFTDIANLTNANIIDGRLQYIRQKTHKKIKIGIPDEAMKIIEKYAPESKGYLFPILNKKIHKTPLQKQNRIHKILAKVNKNLKLLAAELGVEGNVTTYVARHSFASVLKKSGVSIALICVVYDPVADAIVELAPSAPAEFRNEVFSVTIH